MKFLRFIIKFILPVLIVSVGVVGMFALKVEDAQVETAESIERVWPVHYQIIEKQALRPIVKLFGSVVSSKQSRLSAILDAEVIRVNVLPGQSVMQGQILVELDTRNLTTQIDQLQADVSRFSALLENEALRRTTDKEILEHEHELLELATATKLRVEKLKSRNLATEAEFDQAKRSERQALLAVTQREASIREYDSRVKRLMAERDRILVTLKNIERDLEESTVTAPYDGRITAVHIAEGSRVRIGAILVDMYADSSVEIQSLIPSNYLTSLRELNGRQNSVTASAEIDGATLQLKLDRFASHVDPGRGGVDAYFKFEQSNYYPELGRTVDLVLQLEPVNDSFTLPYQAVYGANRVYKIVDGRMHSVSFERFGQVTLDNSEMIVATSASLDDGDKLVLTPLSNAVDGLRVEAVE